MAREVSFVLFEEDHTCEADEYRRYDAMVAAKGSETTLLVFERGLLPQNVDNDPSWKAWVLKEDHDDESLGWSEALRSKIIVEKIAGLLEANLRLTRVILFFGANHGDDIVQALKDLPGKAMVQKPTEVRRERSNTDKPKPE
ncbi:unnamed protein product [Durusdinium trenchii]|uniref:Uncharacterized protein n=1 Tax=Durusdinium trenchii TaxID=1381693 RepID=A0ABP0JKY1_9DINO